MPSHQSKLPSCRSSLSLALSFVLLIASLRPVRGVTLPDGQSIETSSHGIEAIGGIPVEARGTIDEIIASMEVNYPGLIANIATLPAENDLSLHACDRKIGIICCPIANTDWYGALQFVIEDGIKYLNGVKGYCSADPYTCSQVSYLY
ncbi:hypothetical protein IFR05_004892 [Cadophora sp. M221]|nr:hypothetical protein IFR05_004892 [Cadophora sp. M221]